MFALDTEITSVERCEGERGREEMCRLTLFAQDKYEALQSLSLERKWSREGEECSEASAI